MSADLVCGRCKAPLQVVVGEPITKQPLESAYHFELWCSYGCLLEGKSWNVRQEDELTRLRAEVEEWKAKQAESFAQAYKRIQALEQQNTALERALADLVEYCTTGDEGRVEALGRARILVGNKNFPEARTDEQRSQDVQKLVDAAQPFVEVLHSHPAAVGTFTVHATAEQWEALAEALKPFEQEKR